MFDKYGVTVLAEPAADYAEYLTACGIPAVAEHRALCLVNASDRHAANAVLAEVYA